MSTDPGVLFELAARDIEMRPEFRANLMELLERSTVPTEPSEGSPALSDLIQPAADITAQTRRWPRKMLLLAAAVATMIGLAGLQLSRSGSHQPSDQPLAGCESADQLGVIDLTPTDLVIGLSSDGETFCLRMDTSSTAGADVLAVGPGLAQSASTEPTLLEAATGPAASGTYYYLFEIPGSVPVSELRGDELPTLFFTSQVGRRLLVVETFDPRSADQKVQQRWTMYSVSGLSLGTLTAQGPPSRSQTSRAGNGGQ